MDIELNQWTSNSSDLTIGIVTFQRPAQLERLLDIVDDIEAAADEILVIDNDPDASARLVATGRARVRYVHEPKPGVAHARSCLLAEVRTRWLASLDDDEVPLPGWTAAMIQTATDTGAGMVAGPVQNEFETPPEPWILRSGVFDRENPPTGTSLESVRGGNVLFDMEQIAPLGLTYDERFNIGGEDIQFSLEVTKAGVEIAWTQTGCVVEIVPADRLTRDWVRRRWTSSYQNYWRARLVSGESDRKAVAARLAGKVVSTLRALLRGSTVEATREWRHALGAFGALRSG